uniref:Uncharacterized protein n=1 Tax=Triticum urartu TaxID=4572 RepID=A0A8R7PWP4_TRIUA
MVQVHAKEIPTSCGHQVMMLIWSNADNFRIVLDHQRISEAIFVVNLAHLQDLVLGHLLTSPRSRRSHACSCK